MVIDPKLVGKRTKLNFKVGDRSAIMMRTSPAEYSSRGLDEKRRTLAQEIDLGNKISWVRERPMVLIDERGWTRTSGVYFLMDGQKLDNDLVASGESYKARWLTFK